MPGGDLVWHGTTGHAGSPSPGSSNPDPADWRGQYWAAETVHEIQSTLTAAQAPQGEHILEDTARIGDGDGAHALKWIAIQTGAAALSCARVMAFEDATGRFKLDRPLSALANTNDVYRLFAPGNVFPTVTTSQQVAGDTRHRCIALRNLHGSVGGTARRIVIRSIGGTRGQDLQLFYQVQGFGQFLYRNTDTEALFNAVGQRIVLGAIDGMQNAQGWITLANITDPARDVDPSSFALNQYAGVWLRRTIEAGTRSRRSVAVQIAFVTDVTGSDPDPLSSSCIIAYDQEFGVIGGTLRPDRYVFIGGGTRMVAQPTVDGLPLTGRAIRWALGSGDPGTIYADDDPAAGFGRSDDAGEVSATYHASTDEGDAGTTASLEAIVGDGDEVANP